MSFNDDNEQSEFTLFGLHYRATHAEQRRLWMKMIRTTESREWGIATHMMQLIMAPVPMPVHDGLAERMEEANVAMTKKANQLIDEMIAARTS